MKDCNQFYGNDIAASATGDLMSVEGTDKGQQRILRRLLTNPREVLADGSILPADYIWHPTYGAGLPRKVGSVLDADKIRAIIRGQMLLEDCVAKNPEPVITVTVIPNGISAFIQYKDAISGETQTLSFSVDK
jgi:hypothetical protein